MRSCSSLILAACLAVLASAPAVAAEQTVLKELRLEPTPSGARVVVSTSRPPVFTVFRLSGPDRLVIDVASADGTAIRGPRDGQGPIAGINVSQFTDSSSSVGRILVTLRAAKSYDVKADGNQLLVSVVAEGAAAPAVASAAPAPAPKAAPAPAAVTAAPVVASVQAVPAAPASSEASPGADDVVTLARESREVRHPAKRITSTHVEGNALQLSFDGEPRGYELLRLSAPGRLVLDVSGVKLASSVRKPGSGPFATLRSGAHPDKVRQLVDAASSVDGR
ncbi:MAG TPA: AMIN domain-containing protein, partial [Myxococcaceae bacterium]|nr:AMIN domain-containing protein [Myxococcaceae bacterium]